MPSVTVADTSFNATVAAAPRTPAKLWCRPATSASI
jgi:hypothetical protein